MATRFVIKVGVACAALVLLLCAPARPQASASRLQNQSQNRIRIAQDYERRGSYVNALKIYRALFDSVPTNQLYFEGVKRNMIRLKQFDELVFIIKAQIQKVNNVRLYADLGDAYYKKGAQPEAFQTWENALVQFEKQKTAYTYIANAMIANRLYDDAAKMYLKGRRSFGQENLFVFELANIYVLRLKYSEATREYLTHLERHPNQFNYIESRIVNYTKEPEQARKVVVILRESVPGYGQQFLVRKLLANLYLRLEEFALAFEQFRQLEGMEAPQRRQKQAEGKELLFFANQALNAGKHMFAGEAFNLIMKKYPKSTNYYRALFGLATSLQQQGMINEALLQFETLVEGQPNSQWAQVAQFQIGELYFLNLFELDKAESAYQALIKKYPRSKNSHRAYFRIGDCMAAKGELEKAIIWYDRSLNLMPPGSQQRDEGNYKMAYLQFLEGNYAAANENLDKVIEKLGRNNVNQDYVNDALELSFLIAENQTTSEEALRLYCQAEKQKLAHNLTDAVRSLNKIVAEHAKSNVIDETRQSLGEIENARGNCADAIAHFEALIRENSESPYTSFAQKRIAEIYESGLGDLQKAYTAYEKVLVAYPESIYVEDVRARLRNLRSIMKTN